MGDPHGRVGRVDPLSARAAGAIHVDAKVLLVDLELLGLRLVQRGDHVERREGRVAPLLCIERADPDEPVASALGREQPVRVRPVHGEGGRLDPGLVPVMHLVYLDLEALLLRPPCVHPKEHVGPIHRLRPAGPRLDRGDRIVRVVRTGQERCELHLLEIDLERGEGLFQLVLEVGIGGSAQELVDRGGVTESALQGIVAVDLSGQPRELGRDLLPVGGIVPERRIGSLLLQLDQLGTFAVDVKGTPLLPRHVRRWPATGRCARSYRASLDGGYAAAPWHFLYFLPLPHGQGALRGTLSLNACWGLPACPPSRGASPAPPAPEATSSRFSCMRWTRVAAGAGG